MTILQFPLARISLSFVCGIIIANWLILDIYFLFTICAITMVVLLLLYWQTLKNFVQNTYFGVVVLLLSVICGMLSVSIHGSVHKSDHYIHQLPSDQAEVALILTIRERLKNTASNWRYIVEVRQLNDVQCSGLLLLNIRRDSSDIKLHSGMIIGTKSQIYKHRKPLNPNQFDYGKYLDKKSIHALTYVDPTRIIITGATEKNTRYYADRLRQRILSNLDQSDFSDRELAVLAALVLGQRQDLAPDILHDYQLAGAVHILAVSGLHVGLILLFLNQILKLLPNSRFTSIFKLLTILFCLWGFAILASLSPSVVRAVTMFSFVAIGMHIKRSTNIFHTLLVSMLIILLFEPAFLFDVGFQLSYIALFGILWLQPMLQNLWQPKFTVTKYFWSILTVSFAAQIAAFPISIYYFHQFPGLFFITNLIVIPFLSVVMGLGVISMIIATFSSVPMIIVLTLEKSIALMNTAISIIASADRFVLTDIPLNIFVLLSIYLLLITLFMWFQIPNYTRLNVFLSSILLCSILSYSVINYNHQQQMWMLLDTRKNTLIVERTGREININKVFDSLSQWDKNTVNSLRTANYIQQTNNIPKSNFYYYNGKKIALIDSSAIWVPELKPDIVILTQSARINLERMIADCNPKMIVADGSNYRSRKELWRKTCLKANIPFHDTSEKGYFYIKSR